MKCACHLVPNLERLLGENHPITKLVREKASPDPDSDPKGFLLHMTAEEIVMWPRMHHRDRIRLQADHDKYRGILQAGGNLPASDVQRHSDEERVIFDGLPDRSGGWAGL